MTNVVVTSMPEIDLQISAAVSGQLTTSRSRLNARWAGSAWQTESTFHQLSPYIGKTKSSMAAALLQEYAKPSEVVCDPFSGCGTFALEAWMAGCHVLANDLSPYAHL